MKQESDALLFGDALLSFASRREQEGHSELAVPLYQKLSEFAEVPAEIRSRAHQRSEALQGRGPIGAQAEVLVSRFSKEALNPAPILAMGIAGSVFKISRALSLHFLRQAPVDRILTHATANGLGLLTESAAFTLTAKSVASGMGQAQDWSLPALKREWLAGTILLGSIKAGGALGVRSGRDLITAASRTESAALQRGLTLASTAAQPLGLYSGILLSHQVETGLGLRPAQNAANGLIDGAATLFHLYVGGRLAQGLGAERLNRAATEIEIKIGNLPGPGAGSVFSRFFRPPPAIAMAAKAGESLDWRPAEVSQPFRAQAYDSTGSSPVTNFIHEARFVEDFTRRLPGSTSDQLRTLIGNYPPLSKGALKHRFLLMLGRTSISQETGLLEAAIPTLSEALKFAEIGSPSSSYSHWLTKHIFERSLHHNDIASMDGLLRFLGEGGRVSDFEARVAKVNPGLELPKGPPPTPRFWIGREQVYGNIRNLKISSESKIVLSKWVGALASPFRSPLSISDLTLVDRLLYQQGLESIPNRMDQIDRIIRLAGESPLGLARFTRLQNLLEHSTDVLLNFKLEELADPSSTIRGRSHPWTAPESGWPAQSNAYLGDRAPLQLLAEMRSRRADLLDPVNMESRQAHRQTVLEGLFPNGVAFENLKPEVLAETFRRMGDPQSLAVARALLRRDFAAEILGPKAFQHRYNELTSISLPPTEAGYYFPPNKSRTKGVMLLRQPEFSVYSKEASRDALFNLMGNIVHEHRHHLDISPDQVRTPDVHFYQEMNAYFTEFLWKAGHGDTNHYSIWTNDSSLGPAMRFHDFYERLYGHWWKPATPNPSTAWAGRQGP